MEDIFKYFDEKEEKTFWKSMMVLSHDEMACIVVENIYQNNKKLNAFTVNLPKQSIECLGKTQVTGKSNALPIPHNHVQAF